MIAIIVIIITCSVVYYINLVKLTEINAPNNLENTTITENIKEKSNFESKLARFSDTFYFDMSAVSNQKEEISIPSQTVVNNPQNSFQGAFNSLTPILTQSNQPLIATKTVNTILKKPQTTNITSVQNVNAIAKQLIETNGTDPAKMIEILNSIDTSKLSSVDTKELLKVVDYINNVKNLKPNSINQSYVVAINYPNPSMLQTQPVTYVLNHVNQTTLMYQNIINNLAYVNSQMMSGQQ